MKFEVWSEEEIGKKIGEEIIELIHRKENAVLGLATGSSPTCVYRYLTEAYRERRVSFAKVTTFNLDEYIGLSPDHPQSYRSFMNRHLFDCVDIDLKNTHLPSIRDGEDAYLHYDKRIEEAGNIDYQILGIGSNGHIAFNEPGTPFDSLTHIVYLKESTISDNARFFASRDEVPVSAVSMGLSSILKAKKIVLIALGKKKKEAIRRLYEDDPSVDLPASALKYHKDVTIYCDPDAASGILSKVKDYARV